MVKIDDFIPFYLANLSKYTWDLGSSLRCIAAGGNGLLPMAAIRGSVGASQATGFTIPYDPSVLDGSDSNHQSMSYAIALPCFAHIIVCQDVVHKKSSSSPKHPNPTKVSLGMGQNMSKLSGPGTTNLEILLENIMLINRWVYHVGLSHPGDFPTWTQPVLSDVV